MNAGGGASGYYRTSSSYSTGTNGNGITCTTECKLAPGQNAVETGQSQAQLDVIAREMSNKIISDLQAGRIQRNQLNQQWFDSQAADRLSSLQQHHQLEFQKNLQAAASRFHQQNQQNIFNQQQHQQNGVTFVQPNIFTQSQQQQQQQGSYYQQQSQSQHQTYVPVIQTGSTTYTHNTQQYGQNQQHHTTNQIRPRPVTILHGATIVQEDNCTTQNQQGVTYPLPSYNLQNQYNKVVQTNKQTSHVTPTYVTPVVGGNTFQASTTVERNEHRVQPPTVTTIVLPSQNTHTHNVEQEQHHTHTQHNTNNVHVYRPVPSVPSTHTVHTVHEEIDESEVVPSYRPRVVIDKNTKFHELNVQNQHKIYQPVYPQTHTTQTQVEHNQQHVNKQTQNIPIVQPQVTSTVTKEEQEQFNTQSQTHSRPVIYNYPQGTVTQVVNQTHTIHQHHNNQQPQLPIFSHHTEIRNYTQETNNQNNNNVHIYTRPGGTQVTTIETHYVQILPQTDVQYTVQLNELTREEYFERLNRIQQELIRLGYGTLNEQEYNATIASGGFIHNGFKYVYNTDRGRYEKTERVEITEEEYSTLLNRLQDQLHRFNLDGMTEQECNTTINQGYFIRNGVRYIYDSETGHYYKEELSADQYNWLRQQLEYELNRLGLVTTSESQVNQTIAAGYIVINGQKYIFNTQTGQIIKDDRLNISEHEYRTILRRLQDQLRHLGFEQMTETEYNQTISTGFFVRGGNKWVYNSNIGQYEKIEVTEEEYNILLTRLRNALNSLNYRQMSESECNRTIATGTFIRGK